MRTIENRKQQKKFTERFTHPANQSQNRWPLSFSPFFFIYFAWNIQRQRQLKWLRCLVPLPPAPRDCQSAYSFWTRERTVRIGNLTSTNNLNWNSTLQTGWTYGTEWNMVWRVTQDPNTSSANGKNMQMACNLAQITLPLILINKSFEVYAVSESSKVNFKTKSGFASTHTVHASWLMVTLTHILNVRMGMGIVFCVFGWLDPGVVWCPCTRKQNHICIIAFYASRKRQNEYKSRDPFRFNGMFAFTKSHSLANNDDGSKWAYRKSKRVSTLAMLLACLAWRGMCGLIPYICVH